MSKNSLTLEIDYDFTLFSLVSSLRDYRLCWYINKMLGFDFVRQDEIEIQDTRKKKVSYFNLFLHNDEMNHTKYYLIVNKASGENLIPELKQVDYFLMIDGYDAAFAKNNILDELKNLSVVEAVFETDPNGLKSKQNLIFE